jgi:membrane protease YdiL (CAAX protease family)
MRLGIETGVVTIGILALARVLHVGPYSTMRWFLIPSLLVAAALVPSWIARRPFSRIGLDRVNVGSALKLVACVCLIAGPIAFLVQWTATRLGLPIPLRPVFTSQGDCLSWLVYQFLYVAVAEEVFFRGYVQSNVMQLLARRRWKSAITARWVGIVISASCFAVAHVIVQGQVASLLTFFPGLLMAWLFVRTRSLLAPILFHGLANVAYGVMALTLS